MEYAVGGSLADKVKHEGYLSKPVATRYILQVAEALKYIHQHNMNHLDVKPGNIMLNEKDEAVLIDFGLSKQYDTATDTPTSTNISGLSEGYAPLEQYDGSIKKFAPEIDVYSLGATFFKLLTGSTPPTASVVNNEGLAVDKLKNKGVSAKAISIIVKAMEGRRKDRMKDIQTFIDMMNATEASAFETSEPEDNTIPKVSNMQRAENAHNYKDDTTAFPQKQTSSVNNKAVTNNNSTSTTLIAVIAIAVVALIAAFLYMNKPGDTSTPADTIIIDTGAEKEDEDRPAKETIVDEKETNDRDNTEEHQRQAIYKIIKQNVFVRSGPGTTYEPLYSPYNDFDSNNTNGVVVYEGSTVEVISAEQNGFVKVRQSTPNNDRDNWGEGWVSVKFLE